MKLCLVCCLILISCGGNSSEVTKVGQMPNVLIVISDDQSYPHSSIYGNSLARTPHFDRLAESGILFENAFVSSPGCSPSRASILTGMYPWQLEHAGTHASYFGIEYKVLPDILEDEGYEVGFTGKGWGPGDWSHSGRPRNPAGPEYSDLKLEPPYSGISNIDYAGNFEAFLETSDPNKPFLFWMGSKEPHRRFEKGSGLRASRSLESAIVPPFLPDSPEIREDLLDYALEIEWFDEHLGRAVETLSDRNVLENTIIIVTSDNGMAFPAAKANTFEYGIHVPLAISWPKHIPKSQVVNTIVGLPDLAPSILGLLELELEEKKAMTGIDFSQAALTSNWTIPERKVAYSGRERHSSSRYNSLGYPQRAIRTEQYLYIRNFHPERFPAGPPQKYESDGSLGPMYDAYHDIDAAPSLDYIIAMREHQTVEKYFNLAVGFRPSEELYDIKVDPGCLTNLANKGDMQELKTDLSSRLMDFLLKTKDPRVLGNGEIFESYPRVSSLREFQKPEWVSKKPVEVQGWLTKRLQEEK